MRKTFVLIIIFSAVSICSGETIYVDCNASGANDGTSWQNAYKFLQDALTDANNSAKPVDIRVAHGTYTPDSNSLYPDGTGDRFASFNMISDVAIKGGYAGNGNPDPNARNIELYQTILSGDLNGNDVDVDDPCNLPDEPTRFENSYHILYAFDVNEFAVLDGFTITGGYNNICIGGAPERPPLACGAGLLITTIMLPSDLWYPNCSKCSPTIRNCYFNNNCSHCYDNGGGGIASNESYPNIINCCFERNYADAGAGLYNSWGSMKVSDCIFINNCGGGIANCNDWHYTEAPYNIEVYIKRCEFTQNFYGGILNSSFQNSQYSKTTLRIEDCIFENNKGYIGGGLIHRLSDSNITNCKFTSNSAIENNVFLLKGGGGIHFFGGILNLTNCIFNSNTSTKGGGIYRPSDYSYLTSTLKLENCTFYGNLATQGKALYIPDVNLSMKNCILWDGDSEIYAYSTTPDISYCNIEGGWPGVGNIDTDPLFSNPDANDFHLKSQAGRWNQNTQSWVIDANTSPCIDTGDWATPIGLEPFPNGGRINMGAYGGTVEASKSYFGTEPCRTIIAGDTNGDCKVDFADFAIMAIHWQENGL